MASDTSRAQLAMLLGELHALHVLFMAFEIVADGSGAIGYAVAEALLRQRYGS